MKPIFVDYLNVLQIQKWDKKNRQLQLNVWNNMVYDLPNFTELRTFLEHCKTLGLNPNTYFFEQKVTFPLLYKAIVEEEDFDALLYVYKNEGPYYFNRFDKSNTINLLDLGLLYQPNNSTLLEDKYQRYLSRFELSIHELPQGLIYLNDSPSGIEGVNNLIEELSVFKQFCKTHNQLIPESQLNRYYFYYSTYKLFLESDLQGGAYFEFLNENYKEEWERVKSDYTM